MKDRKNYLSIEIGKLKASADGRFAIFHLIVFLLVRTASAAMLFYLGYGLTHLFP